MKLLNPLLNSIMFVIITLQLGSTSFAGGGDYGGGGVGILASDLTSTNKNEKLFTLDLWRYPITHPITDELPLKDASITKSQKTDVDLVLDLIWNKLKQDFPFLSNRLRLNYEKILIFRETDEQLPNTDDHSISIPNPCNEKKCIQIARWDFEYVKINKDWYSKLDLINKAALKLHEVIYTYSNQSNAESVQKIVSLLLDQSFYSKSKTEKEVELLKAFHIAQLYDDLSKIDPTQLGLPNETKIEKNTSYDGLQCNFLLGYGDDENEIKILKNLEKIDYSIIELTGRSASEGEEMELDSVDFKRLKTCEENLKKTVEAQFPRYLYPRSEWSYPIVCFDDDDKLRKAIFTYNNLGETTIQLKERESIKYQISKIDEELKKINESVNSILENVPLNQSAIRRLDKINFVIKPQLEKKLDTLLDNQLKTLPPKGFQKIPLKEIGILFN